MNFVYLPTQPMIFNNYSLAPLLTPGYSFNSNDLMGLGSTLLYKLNSDSIAFEKAIQEQLHPSETKVEETKKVEPKVEIKKVESKVEEKKEEKKEEKVTNIFEELEKIKKIKVESDYKKIAEMIDKKDLEDGHINGIVEKIVNNNKKLYKTQEKKDTLYRFVRTVMYLDATRKLLTNSPALLRKMFEEAGIDVNSPDVKKYLEDIEKGINEVNNLNDLIHKENVILTDEQNLVVLNFLKIVLKNFVSPPSP